MDAEATGSLWKRVVDLFLDEESEQAAAGRARAGTAEDGLRAGDPALGALSGQDFEDRLKSLLSDKHAPPGLVGGKVHLINVSDIRERLGADWDKFSGRVHETIQQTLNTRLAAQDFYTRYKDDAYVIVFGDSSEKEAKLKCALLAEEVMGKLFGEENDEDVCALHIQTVVTRVDGSVELQETTTVEAFADMLGSDEGDRSVGAQFAMGGDFEELLAYTQQKIATFELAQKHAGPSTQVADELQEIIRQLKNFEAALAAADPLHGPWNIADRRAIHTMFENGQMAECLNTVQGLIARAETSLPRETVGDDLAWIEEPVDHAPAPLKLEFSSILVWHAAKKKVAFQFCDMSICTDDKDLPYAMLLQQELPNELVELVDRSVLRKVKQDLQEQRAAGSRRIIGVPVHYSTLYSRACYPYLELCRSIPNEWRKTLIWEAVKAPIWTWESNLFGILGPLKAIGRVLFLRVDPSGSTFSDVLRNLRHAQAAGVHAVGLDLDDFTGTTAELIQKMEKLASNAKYSNLRTYVYGVSSHELLSAAVNAGIDFVSGNAIAGSAGVRAASSEKLEAALPRKLAG